MLAKAFDMYLRPIGLGIGSKNAEELLDSCESCLFGLGWNTIACIICWAPPPLAPDPCQPRLARRFQQQIVEPDARLCGNRFDFPARITLPAMTNWPRDSAVVATVSELSKTSAAAMPNDIVGSCTTARTDPGIGATGTCLTRWGGSLSRADRSRRSWSERTTPPLAMPATPKWGLRAVS